MFKHGFSNVTLISFLFLFLFCPIVVIHIQKTDLRVVSKFKDIWKQILKNISQLGRKLMFIGSEFIISDIHKTETCQIM